MTCLACTHWQPRRNSEMAKCGYGGCAVAPAWQYMAPQHTCASHRPAAESVTQARTAWLHKLDARAAMQPLARQNKK